MYSSIIDVQRALSSVGSYFLLIQTNIRSRKDLGRPVESPRQNKEQFMDFIQNL